MTQARSAPQAPASRPRRPTLGIATKAKTAPGQAFIGEPAIVVVPSAPITYPIKRLRRASENVRHIRIDEDCDTLADGIQSHGLLQSLIGYELDGYIEIVDGGRRLKALRIVRDRGHITDDFLVPVLIRGIEEAVELSLDANIQHRTMSPVDEFRAFAMLMERGDTSPAGLAKRFGLSETVVRQRLRLAKLAQPILDALADREITLDAAMAYATAQEQVLQLQVFEHQAKRGHRGHEPAAVRHSLRMRGIDTADRLYRFVGADRYEREGGGYEQDLIHEVSADRVLDKPFVVEAIANALVDEQVPALIEQLQRDPAWAPTIAGFVKVPDLRLHHDGTQQELRAPLGYVRMTDTDSGKLWATIRANGLPTHVVVGLDVAGELIADPRYAFVPIAQKAAIEKPALVAKAADTAREAASRREADILRYARRFAVPPFAGTPLEGRVSWFPAENDRHYPATLNGVDGFKLPAFIFVPAADVGPVQRREATKHVDQLIAARQQEKGSQA